jgi:hypothetical protein
MGQVTQIDQKRFFTLEEARELLPIVRNITDQASRELELLTVQLNYLAPGEKRREIELRIEGVFENWADKIRRLGCETKGLWLVDFDNGEGYYCWQYPEPDLSYYHGYTEGFLGRVPIPSALDIC